MSEDAITLQSVYESLTFDQAEVLHYLVGCAVEGKRPILPATDRFVYRTFTLRQQKMAEFLIEEVKKQKEKNNGLHNSRTPHTRNKSG